MAFIQAGQRVGLYELYRLRLSVIGLGSGTHYLREENASEVVRRRLG